MSTQQRGGSRSTLCRPAFFKLLTAIAVVAMIAAPLGGTQVTDAGQWIGTWTASPLSPATNGAAVRVEGGLLRSIA